MPAVRRRLLNFLTTLSLVLWLAALLWPVRAGFRLQGSLGLGHSQTRPGLLWDVTEVHAVHGPVLFYRPTLGLQLGIIVTGVPLILRSIESGRQELRVIRRQQGRAANLCTCCNYDLRATPERCPECGTESAVRAGG